MILSYKRYNFELLVLDAWNNFYSRRPENVLKVNLSYDIIVNWQDY